MYYEYTYLRSNNRYYFTVNAFIRSNIYFMTFWVDINYLYDQEMSDEPYLSYGIYNLTMTT